MSAPKPQSTWSELITSLKRFWQQLNGKQKALGGAAVALAILIVTGVTINGNTYEAARQAKVEEAAASVGARQQTTAPSTATSDAKPAAPEPTPEATNAPEPVALEEEKDIQAVPEAATADGPEAQAAWDLLDTLEVKGRAPKTGYDRALFGQRWADVDMNGCDTRNDILRRDLTSITVKPGTNGCKVMSGVLDDPYTGYTINFRYGETISATVQIDHVVALSDAWQTGAQQMDATTREAFANDPENLLAVHGPANQQKGDGDAATWLPSNTSYRCTYVGKQIQVKAKYGLWVKQAEKDAMQRVLSNCGAVAPAPVVEEPAPVVEEPAPVAPAPVEQPAQMAPAPVEQAPVEQPAPVAPAQAPYKNCAEARAAGDTPVYSSNPRYAPHLDRDGDGVGCERG
ncbi:DUF1524 domain-containing protein [Rothia nasimurium]|uniref:DUF1524 domain-containing protein n=1 Tax=Rothia nasimurium TaxID=85336 RepID=A0A4Y9F2N8_9MICC|nr:DUF1524 domain-containing protein [Rothia nasimurium]MBF0808833.1 DUF1524 domain-containing protein [Rothia nasimurium]TFU21279.1 DUF1524 domain-containing protein [Rothia nasimurium]